MYFSHNLFKNFSCKLATSLLVYIALLLSGCGGGGGGVESKSGALTPDSIFITPAVATVANGKTSNFSVTAVYRDGSKAPISKGVTWASADTGIVTIDNLTGVAKGESVGSGVTITASVSGGPKATASITVTSAAITGITVNTTTPSVPLGMQAPFTATASYSDGSSGTVSGSVTWSSDQTVAKLSAIGVASTLAVGATNISASITDGTSVISSAPVVLTVTPAILSTLSITPSTASVTTGITQRFTASGTMTDGTPATTAILGALSWTSSSNSVATVDGTGLVTGGSKGGTNTSNIVASSGNVHSNAAVLTLIPPVAPIGVFAVSGANQVSLSWAPVTTATSYNIYWGGVSGITASSNKITTSSASYVQSGLNAGSTYYYRVSSVNAAGETLSNETFSYIYSGGNPAGTFVASGNLPTARSAPTATLLQNGTVLFTGGYTLNYNPQVGMGVFYSLTSSEIYNPMTLVAGIQGSFNPTAATMNTARRSHTATLLPNGNVLIVGGSRILNISYGVQYTDEASAEIYDPANGHFSYTTGNLNTGRSSHTATLLPNGKVLITGGVNNATTLNSAELYDPATGIFSYTKGNMNAARKSHTATLLSNGKVLIAGGNDAQTGVALKSAEIYDPASDSFAPSNDMSRQRAGQTATLLANGNALVMGGDGATTTTSAEIYNPTTSVAGVQGSFSGTGSMSIVRNGYTATMLPNGNVLVAGGTNASGYIGSAEIYDTSTGLFGTSIAIGSMAGHTAVLLPSGKVLLAGGMGQTGVSCSGAFTIICTPIIGYLSTTKLFQ